LHGIQKIIIDSAFLMYYRIIDIIDTKINSEKEYLNMNKEYSNSKNTIHLRCYMLLCVMGCFWAPVVDQQHSRQDFISVYYDMKTKFLRI